jgi:drug/metabolite transporter (DMT)-like permease
MPFKNFFASENKTRIAVLFLILANIIWGAAFPIYKWTLEIIPPFTFAFLRFFLAALIILPFTYKNLSIAKKDMPLLILVSIISITFQIMFLFFGLKFSPSINAPIILSSGPIVLIIASAFFLKDVVKTKVLVGTLISLLGVLIILFRPLADSGPTHAILGNILILLAMLCGVAQAVVLKKIMYNNSPLPVIFWSFIVGSLPFLLPIFLFEPGFTTLPFLSFQAIVGILYATFLSSIFGYYFLYFGIKYIRASEIGIFSYVDPLATILVAIPLLHETITETYVIAAVLVFLGIYVAEGRIHYHPLHLLRKRDLNNFSN